MKTRYLSAVLALFLLISVIGCAAPAQAPSTAPPAELTPTPEPTPSPSPTPTPTPSPVSEIQATVTEVIDGDTIKVSIAGAIYDVRYIGVDTPELNDKRPQFSALAQEAARLNRQLVEGENVRLEKDISETDHYGRLLRYVYVDDTFVNGELVSYGLAWAKAYEPDTKYQGYFEELEAEARKAGLGIWAPPPPSQSIQVENVQITYIFYDGLVPRVESDEYVEITNLGDQPQDLTGCLLMDISEGYPSFIFPAYILAPGASIRVYTNEYHPEWGGFSFGYSKAIWNNTVPDTAALYDSQGNEISNRSY
jgi:endonuclease YncB( thermonuclease family)